MKKLTVLALLGLVHVTSAVAQNDMDVYESDRRYCASGRSGMDFNSCMRRLQYDRERRYGGGGYGRQDGWSEPQQPQWQQPPPGRWQQPEKPKLSDMQQRALDNCVLLPPREQPKCRATVMSTVR